mgnify:CR=1 FL=1|tara:strand:+ start:1442 stop:2062 length:621 start_codon:yes stop_codon:yes gene_type:complete
MAIIYSYPTLTPQMGDKVLGSNLVDASGNAVTGNPTVQYSFSEIKTLVDQQFIEQFSASSTAVSQGPSATNTVHQIEFGPANNTSTSVTLDVNGKVTWLKTGTYYITQEYYLGGTQNNVLFNLFRTFDGTDQIGATHVETYRVQETSDLKRVVIHQMVNITSPNTYYVFQMLRDSGGANDGTLYQKLNNNSWTSTPSAQLTISKLI